jgi:hypothetical protein
VEEVGTVRAKVGGGEEGMEKKGGEKRQEKIGGKKENWSKRGLSKLIFGQNGRGR